MFSRVRHSLIILFSLSAFLFPSFSNADGNNGIHSLNQEDIIISKLHRVVDRSLLDEFENNGLASIAGGIVSAMIGVSWTGLKAAVTSGGASPLFIDFTVNAFLSGAAMGTTFCRVPYLFKDTL